eukprot:CFRG6905T1
MTATRLFMDYERDLNAKIEVANNILAGIPKQTGETKKASIQRVSRIADDAKDLVNQLTLELRNQSSSSRSDFDTRVKNLSNEVDSITALLKSHRNAGNVKPQGYGATVSQPMLGTVPSLDSSTDHHDRSRDRLLIAQGRLERTTDRLDNSQRVAAETEAIGAGILNQLHEQRGVITRAGDRLNDADAELQRSDRTLRGMRVRAFITGMLKYLLIGTILAIVAIILYLKLT